MTQQQARHGAMRMTAVLAVVAALCLPLQARLAWRQSTSAAHPSRRCCAAVAVDVAAQTLFLFGGRDDTFTLNDTWSLDLSTLQWTQLAPVSAPPPRASMVAGFHNGAFVIAHGHSGHRIFSDIWAYNTSDATPNWVEVEQLGPSGEDHRPAPRYSASGGIFSPSSPLLMTHGHGGTELYSDTWSFDFDTKTWRMLGEDSTSYNPLRPHGRWLAASAQTSDTDFQLFGGCLSGDENAGPCPAMDIWERKDGDFNGEIDMCPTPRLGASLVKYGNTFSILYGGKQHAEQVLRVYASEDNEIALLEPSKDRWRRVRVQGTVPVGRHEHSAASIDPSADAAFVVFGGRDEEGAFLDDTWILEGSIDLNDEIVLSGCSPVLTTLIVHMICMYLAYAICFQLGAFIAHFFRARGEWWLRMHKSLMSVGLVLAITGFVFGVISKAEGSRRFASVHGAIGIIVFAFTLIQPIGAAFRPPPRKSRDEPIRLGYVIWHLAHRWMGRLCLLLSIINITLGLLAIVSPSGVLGLWLGLAIPWVLLQIFLEAKKWRFKETYAHPACDARIAAELQHQQKGQADGAAPLMQPSTDTSSKGASEEDLREVAQNDIQIKLPKGGQRPSQLSLEPVPDPAARRSSDC
eukprot:m.10001 g.10001  ORF g.10001 m.10001 type:complete len:631 (-) comp3042_c0_seq1:71-1963(-)